MQYKRVKGCYDICEQADEEWKNPYLWRWVEDIANRIADLYGFQKVSTPVFESTEVFTRSSGETSDVVTKEMYTFKDKGDRDIALRPEWTAPAIRAYIENGLYQTSMGRCYYFGPCWRYDRSQKGRYRQFYQFGMEIFGNREPIADTETIVMLLDFYRSLGLKSTTLLLNSIGDKVSRETFAHALRDHLSPHFEQLSSDSKNRFTTNPLRILDSKDPTDKNLCVGAPAIADFLSESSKEHFDQVRQHLTALGIPYKIEPSLVRGLDYYCDTVFEVVSNSDTAAQNTLGAGGRYDGLIKQMGGPDLPGIGFGTGIERILQSLIAEKASLPKQKGPEYFFIPLCDEAVSPCLQYLTSFRRAGIPCMMHQKGFQIKKGLQTADAAGATYVIVMGEDELKNRRIKIKHLESREEKEHPFSYLDTLANHR